MAQPPPVTSPSLDALIENVPGNVYRRIRRPDGSYRFAFLSTGLFRHFGVDSERLLAELALRFDWIHPDDRERFHADLELSAATLALLDHRVRVVGHDGRVHWARGIARPELLPDGSVVWDGIVIDITREVEAEAALHLSKAEAERAQQRATAVVTEVTGRLKEPIAELQLLRQLLEEQAEGSAAIRRSLDACLGALRLVTGQAGDGSGEANARAAAQSRRIEAAGAATLTQRQREVMQLLGQRRSNKDIAQRLGISPGTVRLHVAAVLRAVGARSRRELAL